MASITPPGSPTRGLVLPDMSGFDSPQNSPKRSAPSISRECPAAPKRQRTTTLKSDSLAGRMEIISNTLTQTQQCTVKIATQNLVLQAKNYLGEGEYFTVYRVSDDRVVKILKAYHKNNNPIDSHEMTEALENTVSQYKALQQESIPLVPILNIETAEKDGVLLQQMASPLKNRWNELFKTAESNFDQWQRQLSPENLGILQQVKGLFTTLFKIDTIPADLTPDNLAYDENTRTVCGIDLSHQGEEMKEGAFSILLRQNLDEFIPEHLPKPFQSSLHAYLDPRPV